MNRTPRAGFTLIDMTIAAGLLAVLFGMLGQFVSRWEAARHAAEERAFALRTVENFLELASLSSVGAETLSANPEVALRLRSPQLQITRGEPDDLGLIPVTASLSWRNAQGQQVSPVVLTAWKPATAPRAEVSR
jgi:type II secretory pathway pseudopilin PulG